MLNIFLTIEIIFHRDVYIVKKLQVNQQVILNRKVYLLERWILKIRRIYMLSINQFHIIVFMYVNIKDKVHSCTNFCNNMLINRDLKNVHF